MTRKPKKENDPLPTKKSVKKAVRTKRPKTKEEDVPTANLTSVILSLVLDSRGNRSIGELEKEIDLLSHSTMGENDKRDRERLLKNIQDLLDQCFESVPVKADVLNTSICLGGIEQKNIFPMIFGVCVKISFDPKESPKVPLGASVNAKESIIINWINSLINKELKRHVGFIEKKLQKM